MASKLEYLQRYMPKGDETSEKKLKKKRKKDKSTSGTTSSLLIVDEDHDWAQGAPGRSNIEQNCEADGGEDEAPVVVANGEEIDPEDMPVIANADEFKNELEAQEKRKEEADDDLSPPRRARNKAGAEDASPPRRRPRVASDGDSSPPRRGRAATRSDDDNDASPPRGRKAKESDDDASPPRRRRGSEDESPPRRRAKESDDDASPPRRQEKAASTDKRDLMSSRSDASPPRRARAGSDASPPRRRRGTRDSLDRSSRTRSPSRDRRRRRSPSRSRSRGRGSSRRRRDSRSPSSHRRSSLRSRSRSRKSDRDERSRRRHRSPSRSRSTSAPRRRSPSPSPRRRDSNRSHRRSSSPKRDGQKRRSRSPSVRRDRVRRDEDESPPRKPRRDQSSERKEQQATVKQEAPPADEYKPRAGLFTAEEFADDLKRKTAHNDILRGAKAEDMGQNAETVYRDKKGRKLDMLNEMVRQQEILDGKRKREAQEEYEWGTGRVQKQEKLSQKELLDKIKSAPFARGADDEELEKMRRERVRAFDPMTSAAFEDDSLFDGSGDGTKKKKKKSSKKASTRSDGKPKYAGPPAPPNRFNIQPGYRWDGVVRGTNWEEKLMLRANTQNANSDESYRYAVADM